MARVVILTLSGWSSLRCRVFVLFNKVLILKELHTMPFFKKILLHQIEEDRAVAIFTTLRKWVTWKLADPGRVDGSWSRYQMAASPLKYAHVCIHVGVRSRCAAAWQGSPASGSVLGRCLVFDVSPFQAEHDGPCLPLHHFFITKRHVGLSGKKARTTRKQLIIPATAAGTKRWWEKWPVCDVAFVRMQIWCGNKGDYRRLFCKAFSERGSAFWRACCSCYDSRDVTLGWM